MVEICKRWLPLFVWVVLIFGLSSIPDLSTGSMTFPTGTDKVVHFGEYAVLALLFYRGLSYGRRSFRWVLLLVTYVTAVGVAGLDEMYQSYIPGRDSSFFDLLADIGGITVASLIMALKNIRMDKEEK